MRYTVVLTAEFPALATELLAPHFDVVAHPTEHDRSEDDVATLLAEADAAIVLLSDPITRHVLESNPNLRIVSNFAVGYNNIDLAAARELGVTVTNTPGVLTDVTGILLLVPPSRRFIAKLVRARLEKSIAEGKTSFSYRVQMGDAQVQEAVAKAIAEANASGVKDMGKVMALLKSRLAGRADMGQVSGLVKAKLSG